jgi:hypothetical protein
VTQISLFGADFDGVTFDHDLDHPRLTGQLARVFRILSGGEWWTIPGIERATAARGFHDSPQAISARIRDLRKEKFGGFTVEHRRIRRSGLWEYRIVWPAP